MSKQDLLKVQTCVLRVHIHCEGCMHKVKKKLQKVDGVYKVSIDSVQGKVVVSGNADPMSLIEKLEKAGKHAELWGPPQKGGQFPIQLNKFQIDNLNKGQKKGNEQHQHQQQQQQHLMKNGFVQVPLKKGGSKDDKFQLPKDHNHKSVRFDVPQHEEEEDEDDDVYDDEDDDFDEFDDEEDDEFDDEFGEGGHGDFHGKPPAKAAVGQKPNKAAGNGHKGDKGGGKDGKAKKGGGGGGGIDMFIKGMLKKAGGGGKKGKSDKSEKKGGKKKDDGGGGKNGGKKGGFDLGDAKKGKSDDGWGKKAGDNFHGGKHQHQHQQQGFGDMKPNHKGGGGGGGGGGKNMDMNHMMGQKGGFPAVPGMPAMNGGRFPGVGAGNPYNQQQQQQQQQYMAQMMMMNQQRENGHESYHPALAYARPPPPAMSYGPPPGMGYGQPQHMGYGQPPPMSYGQAPPMSYGPPPASAEYTHMFSDENTGSCSIM